MRLLKNQSGQVLIILLSTMLGGGVTVGIMATGQPIKQIQKKVKNLEMDEVRQDEALKLVKSWKKSGKAFWKADEKNLKKLLKLMKKYETTPEDLQEFLDKQDSNAAENRKVLLDTRFALKEQMTKDEWDEVFISNH